MIRPLGEILSASCGLGSEDLEAALAVQQDKGGRLGDILVAQRRISESDLLAARGEQCGLEVVHRLPARIDPFFVPRVPIGFLKKFKMIPVATPEDAYLAMAEPSHFQQADDLQRRLDWEGIRTVLAPQQEIFVAINAAYDTIMRARRAAR